MHVMNVRNVDEAVSLCTRLKQEGKYDWFRGQRQNWPLQSSFCRLDEIQQSEAVQRIASFEHWVKNTPGLESIASSTDMTIAVAQHYGLPTNFIDFTTDPIAAGFFASTEFNGVKDSNEYSCILCLDTHDLEDYWVRAKQQSSAKPEFIRLSVPNLWRLEAQSGVFLYCPAANFEDIYDLDRILFPPTQLTTHIPEHGYYPKRKSALEVLLDQFFMNEKLMEGTQAIRSIKGFVEVQYAHKSNRCNPDFIIGGDMPTHESWNPENLIDWLTVRKEGLKESVTKERFHIDLDAADSPNDSGNAFRAAIEARLAEDRTLRSKLAMFSFSFTSSVPQGLLSEGNLLAAARLWDGLRRLPFTDEEVATGLGNCLALDLWGYKLGQPQFGNFELTSRACFGDVQEVEFGAWDGSYSKAYAGKKELLGCVRRDVSTFLTSGFKEQSKENIGGLLQGCSDPKKLFDFHLLTSLFATQISPVQVLTRSSAVVYFSPAGLNSFGLP
jgi:hypothetical protein